jgi:hypothetical protein
MAFYDRRRSTSDRVQKLSIRMVLLVGGNSRPNHIPRLSCVAPSIGNVGRQRRCALFYGVAGI